MQREESLTTVSYLAGQQRAFGCQSPAVRVGQQTTHSGHPSAAIGCREAVIGKGSRSRGTNAACRCMNSSGIITRRVFPSRQGVFSLNFTADHAAAPLGGSARVVGSA